jgi:hypothetical protein
MLLDRLQRLSSTVAITTVFKCSLDLICFLDYARRLEVFFCRLEDG